MTCPGCKATYHGKCINWSFETISLCSSDWYCNKCLEDIFPFHHIDCEQDFQTIVAENMLNSSSLYSKIDNMIFNPFEINEGFENPLSEIDPDFQFYSSFTEGTDCDYYLEENFIKKIASISAYSDQLSFFHMNCRSFALHYDSIVMYLDSLCFSFLFSGFCETRMSKEKEDLYCLDSCTPIHEYREDRPGGGVSLFVNNKVSFKRRKDLEYFDSEMESIFIEVEKEQFNSKANIIVALIYRMPDSCVDVFTERMESILNIVIRQEKKIFYLLGDINVCLLKSDSHRASLRMIEMFYSYGIFPVINKPTRVTRDTATLIDHIWTNNLNTSCENKQGILCSTISDHFSIFHISLNQQYNDSDNKQPILQRQYTQQNIEKFSDTLDKSKWNNVTSLNETSAAFTTFQKEFTKIYTDCFPLRPLRKAYYNRKPWLTPEMKESIKNKNKLYMNRHKGNFEENDAFYKKFKNRLSHILKTAERKYYAEQILKHKSNMKKTWAIIKQVINKNKYSSTCKKFKHNDKTIEDGVDIANGFNDFYVNVGQSLARKIPKTNKAPCDFMKNCNVNNCTFTPAHVTPEEVLKIIANFKDSAAGWDELKPGIVKIVRHSIHVPLAHISNLSFNQGLFPSELKLANVVPIYKDKDKMLFSNYRPVSVLPVFSKVLERLMYNRLFDYINENRLLYKYQFGFQKGKSTNMAIILLVDKISEALENGDIAIGVFLDFSKAFDTVDHEILLKKLDIYGVRGKTKEWFSDYLSNRKQYVTYCGFKSNSKTITCGVPQGSILGPLLFLLYINDLAAVSNELFSILFADDSNMFIIGKDINVLCDQMNIALKNVQEWLFCNKLSLNVLKTHYMIFTAKRKVVDDIKLVICNTEIERAYSTKFLGVHVDSKFSWSEHVTHICKKLSKSVAIMYKARKKLPKSSLISLYYSICYPYFIYCNHVWGRACQKTIEPVFKIQKKMLRVITSSPYRAPSLPLFVANKLLPLQDINSYMIGIFMFNVMNSGEDSIFSSYFILNSSIHSHHTRTANALHVPRAKNCVRISSIKILGAQIWNDIPNSIRNSTTVATFKINLKKHLIDSKLIFP